MSDPRNFMKALEVIRLRGYVWSMGGDPHKIERTIYTIVIWGHSAHLVPETYNKADAATLEEVVVTALAALYDAEHKADPQPDLAC